MALPINGLAINTNRKALGRVMFSPTGVLKFVTLLLIAFFSTQLMAQEVAKITKKKGIILVHVNDISTLKSGQEACVTDVRGKKIVCGKITKMQKGKVLVKFSNPAKLAAVKKGMKVAFTGSKKVGGSEKFVEEEPASPSNSRKNSMVVRALWVPALLGPVTYNKIAYNPPSTTEGQKDALWISDQLIKTSFLAFGASVTIPFGPSMGLTPGFRYRSYSGSTLETDYDLTNKKKYASITQSMTAIGLWTDFQVLRIPFGSTTAMTASGGLDFEMSTAKTVANLNDETDDSSAGLADSTSKLSVISLRLGTGVDAFFLGSVGVNIGVNLLVPLVALGKSITTSTEDPQSARSEDDIADFNAALNHKKASFGLDITLGLAMSL